MKHVAFFGDGERTFALPFDLVRELERKTGAGIGTLFYRVKELRFAFTDITETIRLGLIGGGTTPAEAAALVTTYAEKRPLAETFPIALGIIDAVWFGTPAKPITSDTHEAARTGDDLSAAVNAGNTDEQA